LIRLEKVEEEKNKNYILFFDEEKILESELESSSVTNKFHLIINWVNELCEKLEGFNDFFKKLILEYINEPTKRLDLLKINFVKIVEFIRNYEEISPIDYDKFIDMSKVKSGSIFFSAQEIFDITLCSNTMKIFNLFIQIKELKLAHLNAKEIYNDILDLTIENSTITKILDVVKTKAYKYNVTDRYMWDYIKQMRCHDTECQISHMFSFIMNNILILCERGKNPITFTVSTINEQIHWFLRTVYRDTCKYTDQISTEEVNEPIKDNLRAYSYNFSIGQLIEAARNKTVQNINEQCVKLGMDFDNKIVEFDDLLEKAQFLCPISEFVTYPILSKSLDIPYEYFKPLNINHSIQINIYIKNIMERVFDGEMSNLMSLLEHYPVLKPPYTSALRLKQIEPFSNNMPYKETVFGFISSTCSSDLIKSFVGKVARNTYVNVFTNKIVSSWPQSQLEEDIMFFYLNWFNTNDMFIKNKLMNISRLILKDI
jgi:hypothetical protein